MSAKSTSERSLYQRLVPARVRQEARLLFLSGLVLASIALLLGSVRMRPTVFSSAVNGPSAVSEDVQGRVDLFDPSVQHSLTIDVSDAEYAKLVADYEREGEKTWIEADATLDGTALGSVGIRLKGNSTLMSLRKNRSGGPSGFPAPPGGLATPPAGAAVGSARPEGGPASMANVSFAEPSSLPLLLSFNHFIKGRGYQGLGELAVRPVVGKGANLNEALALKLVAESGQPSQRFTWVRFRLGGGEVTTRLLVENPDQGYAERLGFGEGVLFKSRSSNRFAYVGDDPTSYAEDFSQLSAKGSLDATPVIRLLKFLENASDATFDSELSSVLDVERFAEYVATHELLDNFDDISGPGRNFLLWYDLADERCTVITWDLNLALGGMGGMGAPPGGMEGMGAPPGGMAGPPSGSALPPGFDPAKGPPGMPGLPGAASSGKTALKQRFLASEAYAPLRERASARLRALWFDSGLAARLTAELLPAVEQTQTLSAETLQAEYAALLDKLAKLALPSGANKLVAPTRP